MKKLTKYSLQDDETKKYIKFSGEKIAFEQNPWSHGTTTEYTVYLTDNNQYAVRKNFYTRMLDSNGRPEQDAQYVKLCANKTEILDYLTFFLPVGSDPRLEKDFRGKTRDRALSDLLENLCISHEYIQQLDYPREKIIKITFDENGERL